MVKVTAVLLLVAAACGHTSRPRMDCPAGTTFTDTGAARGCKRADGTWHGPFEALFDGGKVSKTGAFRDGVVDGGWTVYAPDGRVLGTFAIVDGAGVALDWHDNGQKARESTYRAGKLDGAQRTWHPNGAAATEVTYRDGQIDGLSSRWSETGVKLAEQTFEAGREHGSAKTWDASGELIAEDTYAHGTRVRHTTYDHGQVTANQEWPVQDPTETRIATRGFAGIDPAWQSCERHDECELVETTCCACGAADAVAVNYRQVEAARKIVTRDCSTKQCPAQYCNRVSGRCDAGSCVSAE